MLKRSRAPRCLRSFTHSRADVKRYVSGDSQKPAATEPFVLPRVVIDLDASESPYVRRWEDMNYKAPPNHTRKPAMYQRKQKMQVKYSDQQSTEKKVQPQPVVSPLDLWAYALGHDVKNATQLYQKLHLTQYDAPQTYIQRLYQASQEPPAHLELPRRPVPPSTRHIDLISTALKAEQLAPGSDSNSHLFSALERRIKNEKLTLADLDHALVLLSTSDEGCRTIISCGRSIVNLIKLLRKASSRTTHATGLYADCRAVCIFLNNLTLNLKLKGFIISSHLCNAGLHYAVKSRSIPALKMYLRISTKNHLATNNHTASALKLLFRLSKSTKRFRELYAESNFSPDDILRLLTGYESDDGPTRADRQHPNFHDLLSQPFEPLNKGHGFFQSYIVGLAHIKWSQTIDHEMLQPHATVPLDQKAMSFASAHLLLQDGDKALSILQDMALKLHDSSFDIDIHYNSNTTLINLIQAHYWCLGLAIHPSLKERVSSLARTEPEDVLRDLESVLVTDLPSELVNLYYRRACWMNLECVPGLVISKPSHEIKALPEPEFFKPLGKREWVRLAEP